LVAVVVVAEAFFALGFFLSCALWTGLERTPAATTFSATSAQATNVDVWSGAAETCMRCSGNGSSGGGRSNCCTEVSLS